MESNKQSKQACAAPPDMKGTESSAAAHLSAPPRSQGKEDIKNRIQLLRKEMETAGTDISLFISTDPHSSEYICDHDKITEFLSGCTSDNATLIISQAEARLWTDGRYFISAAEELADTGIELMKMGEPGVPTVEEYLRSVLKKGCTLGYDGRYVSAVAGETYRGIADACGALVSSSEDLVKPIWFGRPARPAGPIRVLPFDLSGCTCTKKIEDIRSAMEKEGCGYHVISRLDDIMWTLNIRGSDIPCNPVAISWLMIGMETVDVFLQPESVSPALTAYMKENKIKVHPYQDFFDYIRSYHFESAVLLDYTASSDAMAELLADKAHVVNSPNPTTRMKALKNPVEADNSRRCYLQDSAAVCRFLYRMKQPGATEGMTEYKAAKLMDSLREELPGYLGLSFPTISAYGANAAMAHYAPDPEHSSPLKAEGFLLVDSGGQYDGGTTDVTRTIVLGDLTEEMKRDFTLTACSNLALLYAKFASGTTGSQLDMLAREKLYRYGINYNHGTGHGVGYMLNVHEGPQRIAMLKGPKADPPMEPGMITSDEPGVYREGRYGIRTESIMLAEEDYTTEFGEFYRFRPLTLVPIDLDGLDIRYMDEADVARLNSYHRKVREMVSPLLNGEEREWLAKATHPLDPSRCGGNAGQAGIAGNAGLAGQAAIAGNAGLAGQAAIAGNAAIAGQAGIAGYAAIAGNAAVAGQAGSIADNRGAGAQAAGSIEVKGAKC